MDFRFVPSDPVSLTSCHILISKQDTTIRALRSSRCVTGRRSRDENHAVRFRQSVENRSPARDTQLTRGVSDELSRGCKRLHPLAPGRRYGKKKSSLWVYVSPPNSHTPQKTSTLSRIKCERYIFLSRSVFVRSLKFVNYVRLCFRLYMYVAIQQIRQLKFL